MNVRAARTPLAGGQTFVPDEVSSLRPFADAGLIGPAEVHLAAWVACESRVDAHELALAVALAARVTRHGHSCAVLTELRPMVVDAWTVDLGDGADEEWANAVDALDWPDPDRWAATLAALPADVVRCVDHHDDPVVLHPAPLVLAPGGRVYLQRHWVDESSIVATLRTMCAPDGDGPSDLHPDALTVLDTLLPRVVDGAPNLQRSAADVAATGRVSVVVGGPGTGKTYTVSRLLAALATDARRGGRPLRVALAAPTGKAAARLQESIGTSLTDRTVRECLDVDVLTDLADLQPTTIHRLLGSRMPEHRHRFRHDADRPLPYDVVVIDETSMVSAPLLARLVEAVPSTARLVLLGDPDQLESVELGAVLADLVRSATPGSPLDGRVVRLDRGHRFGSESAIARLADAVRRGDAEAAVGVLRAGDPAVEWIETDDPVAPGALEAVRATLDDPWVAVRRAAEEGDAAGAHAASMLARILCAHRRGPFGVATWNVWGERWLRDGERTDVPRRSGAGWYPGRLLLATRNDPRLRLANGDTGVVVRAGDQVVAAFVTGGGVITLDPVQLADVETAFATTVHKSQGSEYPSVVMVLPPPGSPLAGRELLYTGVTRARERVLLVGSEESVRRCVTTPARRMTGLAEGLGA